MAVLSPDYTGDLIVSIATADGTVMPPVTLVYRQGTGDWAAENTGVCYCGTGCCGNLYLGYASNSWATYCFSGEEGGCWIGQGAELKLGVNLIETLTWSQETVASMKPLAVVITKAGEELEPEPEPEPEPAKGGAISRIFELYRRAAGGVSGSDSGGGDEPAGEALPPDYTGDLLLNITTDDGTVLKTLTLIYEGISYDISHWETAGDDLGTCYCGTGCCDAVYLRYDHDEKNWFTECYVEEEGGCWQWTGTELILGKNLVTSIETGKPLSVVITKAGEELE